MGSLFQLVGSTFNWIDQVMDDVGEKVSRMLKEEASRNRTVEGRYEQEEKMTIKGLLKKYLWWTPAATIGKAATLMDKTEETASLFEGKNTRV